MEKLIDFLKSIAPLSPGLESHLRTIIQQRHVNKKEIILRFGEVAQHVHFIEKGIARSYVMSGDADYSVWFMLENDIFAGGPSLIQQKPSVSAIEALEDLVLWSITYDQLQYIYRQWPEFLYHRSILLEKYYVLSEQRHIMTHGQTALQRYENLVLHESHLLARIPYKYLASYLGINESTFSVMRKQFLEQHRSTGLPGIH